MCIAVGLKVSNTRKKVFFFASRGHNTSFDAPFTKNFQIETHIYILACTNTQTTEMEGSGPNPLQGPLETIMTLC